MPGYRDMAWRRMTTGGTEEVAGSAGEKNGELASEAPRVMSAATHRANTEASGWRESGGAVNVLYTDRAMTP
jgi:hypothetical protein